jgi:hypothetical protein
MIISPINLSIILGENYTFDTDIYSLGLSMIECALGYYPY